MSEPHRLPGSQGVGWAGGLGGCRLPLEPFRTGSVQGQAVRLPGDQETTRSSAPRMRLAQWQKSLIAEVGDKVGKQSSGGCSRCGCKLQDLFSKAIGAICNTENVTEAAASALGIN